MLAYVCRLSSNAQELLGNGAFFTFAPPSTIFQRQTPWTLLLSLTSQVLSVSP